MSDIPSLNDPRLRVYIATRVLTAIASSHSAKPHHSGLAASIAVEWADALIKELTPILPNGASS